MDYFRSLQRVLLEQNIEVKFKLFKNFYEMFQVSKINFKSDYEIANLTSPSYSSILNIVPAQKIKARKYSNTKEYKIFLLHSIAHIEYSAIDLAIDAALRFKNLPRKYYEDWLKVAEDEIRHFTMIRELLRQLGADYGDLQVHTSLFEAMKNTQDLLSRMAIVPRYLEANGLDQNPKIMERLRSSSSEFNIKILNVLNIILEEEVDHVKKGDKWFKYECKKQNLDPQKTYFDILEKVYPGSTNKKYKLNIKARKQAGFSCEELKLLSKD